MKFPRRRFLRLAAGAVALPAVSRIARAQVYPLRPITIVVPFPAGGSTDVIGRILAEKMRASLGQTIIIENVGAAGGSIGVGRVARAAPDGYTLDIGQWDTHVANGATYPLSYNLQNDDAGFGGGADRHADCPGRHSAPPGASRRDQGVCHHGQEPLRGGTRHTDRR